MFAWERHKIILENILKQGQVRYVAADVYAMELKLKAVLLEDDFELRRILDNPPSGDKYLITCHEKDVPQQTEDFPMDDDSFGKLIWKAIGNGKASFKYTEKRYLGTIYGDDIHQHYFRFRLQETDYDISLMVKDTEPEIKGAFMIKKPYLTKWLYDDRFRSPHWFSMRSSEPDHLKGFLRE